MMSNFDTNTINNTLEQICAHPQFAKSTVYTRLLRYLVEKAIQKEDIKEYSIGADLFNKNYLNDKNDGAVRIHMYKLRKKLATYYSQTSSQHNVFFQIEKGQYNLHFVSKKEYQQQFKSSVIEVPLKAARNIAIALVVALLATIVIIAFFNQPSEIWGEFLKHNSQNMVVVSDNYVLMHTNPYGEKRATLYNEINSDDDFLAYKKMHPERQLATTGYTLLSKMAPFSTQILTQWFLEQKSSFTLQLESELSLDDIKENNLVFVGQYSSMNLSNSFYLKDSKLFAKIKDGYTYKNNGQKKTYKTRHNPKGKIEYAMVSYCCLSPGRKAIYFVSNHDIGVMATLRNFTDKKWLKEFYNQLPPQSEYFNALFEVSGIHRTDVSCKLVELEILE